MIKLLISTPAGNHSKLKTGRSATAPDIPLLMGLAILVSKCPPGLTVILGTTALHGALPSGYVPR